MRRWLHFTIDEWEALPWWQQRLYVDGMRDEAQRNRRTQEQTQGTAGFDGVPADMAGGDSDDESGLASRFTVHRARFGSQ